LEGFFFQLNCQLYFALGDSTEKKSFQSLKSSASYFEQFPDCEPFNYCASVFKAAFSALDAQHALPLAQDFSFATTLFVGVAAASAEAVPCIFAQQAAVLLTQAAFSAAVQAVFILGSAEAVCADANVANPAKAKSNANFFIISKMILLKNNN
jgi:hypothetical protein